MPSLDIKIHRCNPKEPAYLGIQCEMELQFNKCIVIEQGMGSGKTALAFTLTDPATGLHYFAQTSADILRSLIAGVKGAEEHWAENPVENI